MSLSVIRKRRFSPKKVLNIKLYIHVLGLQTLKFNFFLYAYMQLSSYSFVSQCFFLRCYKSLKSDRKKANIILVQFSITAEISSTLSSTVLYNNLNIINKHLQKKNEPKTFLYFYIFILNNKTILFIKFYSTDLFKIHNMFFSHLVTIICFFCTAMQYINENSSTKMNR